LDDYILLYLFVLKSSKVQFSHYLPISV